MMDVVADVKEDGDKAVVQTALQKLFEEVAPRFEGRNGGYTRIIKMNERRARCRLRWLFLNWSTNFY